MEECMVDEVDKPLSCFMYEGCSTEQLSFEEILSFSFLDYTIKGITNSLQTPIDVL